MTCRAFALCVSIVVLACRPGPERAPGGESAEARVVARPDSSRIVVTGPTLVVFFRGAYAVADSANDATEVLGDLQYHLGSARPAIDSLGVAIVERYGDYIDYEAGRTKDRFMPPADSGVGYLFLHPDAAPLVRYGVMTDGEMIEAVRTQFGLGPAPARR